MGVDLVVGSGPSGAACARALVGLGRTVRMLDAGLQVEPHREELRRKLAATTPAGWSPEDLDALRYQPEPGSGLGRKRTFGSDVAYRQLDAFGVHPGEGVGLVPSFAKGGLSNVWGATFLPYSSRELARWPLASGELDDGYREALAMVPFSGGHDDLAEEFPLWADRPQLLQVPSARAVHDRLDRHRARLQRRGYRHGVARLAVRTGRPAPAAGCTYCGRCLDGCPYGHIYCSSSTIDQLVAAEPRFTYQPGVLVRRIRSEGDRVVVVATDLDGADEREEVGDRCFLAAGVVATAAILQRSGLAPPEVAIHDSQTTFLPMAWAGRGHAVDDHDPGYTLAQTFLTIDDPAVSDRQAQVQLYGYNDSLRHRAAALQPALARLAGPALGLALRQLVVGIAYLHSDDSGTITSVLDGDRIDLVAARPASVEERVQALLRSMATTLGPLGLAPVVPLAQVAAVGEGFHAGATVAMAAEADGTRTDRLGRPKGCEHVHVVDASSLPTLAAGAITMSAMANAIRIARAS